MRAALAALLFTACGPDPVASDAGVDGPVVCEAHGAAITIGTGTGPTLDSFRALSDGDTVYLSPGPQGGQHIWTGLRGTGFDPRQPRIQLAAENRANGEVLGQFIVSFSLVFTGGIDEYAMLPQPLALENNLYCAVLPGDVTLRVRLDDRRGHCVTRSVVVHVAGIDPMADPRDRESRETCCAQHLVRCFPDGGASRDATAD